MEHDTARFDFVRESSRRKLGATRHTRVITSLRSGGHEIDDCDLYAESFSPVMSEQERVQYHNVELNRAPIAAYADRLLAAEPLVLVYPVWNEGFPAILKGFFNRVFIPGVSFKIGPDGAAVPNLQTCESSPWRRSSEHSRLGRLSAPLTAAGDPRLRPQGRGGRRISEWGYKAWG